MYWLKNTVAVAVLTAGLFAAGPTEADAQDRFAVMTLQNQTSHVVNFQYKIGKYGAWTNASIQPNGWHSVHSAFSYPNSYQFAPIFIRYDEDLRPGGDWIREVLPPKISYSPNIDFRNGFVYRFTYDGYNRQFLVLR